MNKRYYYCPQMKIYDTVGYKWTPNLMFMNNPNYRSNVCNTDVYGLRFNNIPNDRSNLSIFKSNEKKDLFVMVGSSTTFGVGSTSDDNTIPSILSELSTNHFLNFGGRAFNGFQEILLFQLFIEKVKKAKQIILYSGINDVYMSYNKNFISEFPGPFFFNKEFLSKMNNVNLSLKRKILKFFLPNLNIDYRTIQFKDFFNLFKKDKFEILNKAFPKISLNDIVKRNLMLWSNLANTLNVKINFFLPPFINWCKNKSDYTNEEIEIQNYISNEGNLKYHSYYDSISNDYKNIRSLFKKNCEENKIQFYDCNEIFREKKNINEWLFVDRVHLTDYGNLLISKFLLSKL